VAKRDLFRDKPAKLVWEIWIGVQEYYGDSHPRDPIKFPCSVCRQEERNIRKLSQIQFDREILYATLGVKARKFPVFFPVSREMGAESGSVQTASTTRFLHVLPETSIAIASSVNLSSNPRALNESRRNLHCNK
jgi:hypothetical protein